MDASEIRVALIAGGSGGIGAAVARRLGADGYRLALVARSEDRLRDIAAGLAGNGRPDVSVFPCDVTRGEAVRTMVEEVQARFGRIDVLVNAAGVNRPGLFLRLRPEDWEDVLRVNLTGVMLTTQAVVRVMRRQRTGYVLTIASMAGRQGRVGMSSYCASKFGVVGLMDTLRREVEKSGIRVTTILPGEVDTAMHGDDPHAAARRIRPEDVALAVSFALRLSDRAVLPEIELHNRVPE